MKTANEHLTPIFTPEMGKRLALIRMRLMWEQSEVALRLGISQQNVSAIESGRMSICKKLNMSRFVAVFQDASNYILLGTRKEKWEMGNPRKKYWDFKHAERTRKRIEAENKKFGEHWRHREFKKHRHY